MVFDEIIGNDHIKEYFRRALQKNTLSNTLLFSGIEGIGKFLFAKALSTFLLYSSEISDINLNKINKEIHPDLHIYRPEGKTALHNISSIRNLIEEVSLAPYEAEAKIFIIEEAHRMLPSGFNALLKTLEEPYSDCYIILITDKEEELLSTIVSRCITLKFSPLSNTQLISLLKKWGKTSFEAKRIAALSQGSISRASEISSFVEDDDKTQILLDILAKNKIRNYFDLSLHLDALQSIFDSYEDFSKRFKALDVLVSHIFMWYRDLHLYKEDASIDLLFYNDKINLIKDQNFKILPSLDKVSKYLFETKLAINRNIKIKTSLEDLFLKLDLI